jgi:hypothetical protein
MCKVLNKRCDKPTTGCVYVGRPTVWGNCFTHERWIAEKHGLTLVASREEAVRCYREWLLSQPSLIARAQRELRGRDLVCWCAPLACHAGVLLEVANG